MRQLLLLAEMLLLLLMATLLCWSCRCCVDAAISAALIADRAAIAASAVGIALLLCC
jgi:hypothetical protein